ncbi:hypothetical protein BV898_09788 [Hypsibius exemplaris]|uniref:Uncharacterized protein n=1 Tax=Hypsibius exemplaris TaxID=2072580 RepID=A0A1W0WLD2_HYPEX|nr:hypothetical protein BV898_09788 [Hypsibius exemplaris]
MGEHGRAINYHGGQCDLSRQIAVAIHRIGVHCAESTLNCVKARFTLLTLGGQQRLSGLPTQLMLAVSIAQLEIDLTDDILTSSLDDFLVVSEGGSTRLDRTLCAAVAEDLCRLCC